MLAYCCVPWPNIDDLWMISLSAELWMEYEIPRSGDFSKGRAPDSLPSDPSHTLLFSRHSEPLLHPCCSCRDQFSISVHSSTIHSVLKARHLGAMLGISVSAFWTVHPVLFSFIFKTSLKSIPRLIICITIPLVHDILIPSRSLQWTPSGGPAFTLSLH